MEQPVTCKEALSEARDIAKHTIANMYEEICDDDIMTHSDASVLYKSVMTIIEVTKVIGEKDI